jgi:hypothetical protein
VRFAFADVTDPGKPLPFAGYGADQMDFIASEAKVEIMYAAFVLRDMARRFATATSPTSLDDLVAKLAAQMNPAIRAAVPEIASASNITDLQREPGYKSRAAQDAAHAALYVDMLKAAPAASGALDVGFTDAFTSALRAMIVPSSNAGAGKCVHGVGYGYLNGALAAGGFFDRSTSPATGVPGVGLWEAGDFQGGTSWPFVSLPPGNVLRAQLGTTRQMVKLVSLMVTKPIGFLDAGTCDEMLNLMKFAVGGAPDSVDRVFLEEASLLRTGSVTHNKIGLESGKLSEIAVLHNPVNVGHDYVVAFHNVPESGSTSLTEVTQVVKDTIADWEKPPPPPTPPPPTP